MCNVCCKEFKGWCKSFTKTEVSLASLQVVLLATFIGFLTFLILHLIACLSTETFDDIELPNATSEKSTSTGITSVSTKEPLAHNTTIDPLIECTWKPSEKTEAVSQYYENDTDTMQFKKQSIIVNGPLSNTTPEIPNSPNESLPHNFEHDNEASVLTDGVTAEVKNYLFALVKLKLSQDVTFGCVLTVISQFWTLTAASCIESIEEVDAVDSFVIMESYIGTYGKTHTLSDILIHPEYQGVNKKYDLAALKSEDSLINEEQKLLRLPTMLDALLLTIGEQLNLISYGATRWNAHKLGVHMLSGAQCASTWAPRHLVDKGALEAGGCGTMSLCVAAMGVRGGSGGECTRARCAGAPILRDGVLLGVSGGECGDPCTPFLGAHVALSVDWLRGVTSLCYTFSYNGDIQKNVIHFHHMNKALIAWSVVMAVFVVAAITVSVMQMMRDASSPTSIDYEEEPEKR